MLSRSPGQARGARPYQDSALGNEEGGLWKPASVALIRAGDRVLQRRAKLNYAATESTLRKLVCSTVKYVTRGVSTRNGRSMSSTLGKFRLL